MSKKNITFTMEEEVIKKIKDYADENYINLSALSQKLIEEYLEKKSIKE